jgi:hypothetical protein
MSPLLRRPVESDGTTPGGEQPRFPGYDVLGEIGRWDATTAGAVLDRLTLPPPVRFFDLAEEAVGRALFDQLLDQHDDPRVPVFELVDSRLAEAESDGWRYADLPEDGEAFRRSFAGLDDDACDSFGQDFARLNPDDQAAVIEAVRKTQGSWHGMPASQVWSLWTRYACTAFYSHPWAWNEIGFGGPAYPRGYKNLGINAREPWEVADHHNVDPVARRTT